MIASAFLLFGLGKQQKTHKDKHIFSTIYLLFYCKLFTYLLFPSLVLETSSLEKLKSLPNFINDKVETITKDIQFGLAIFSPDSRLQKADIYYEFERHCQNMSLISVIVL